MKKVALIIGHGPQLDCGATNPDGTTELQWNRALVARIASALKGSSNVTPEVVHRATERVQPVAQVNATGADFAIEFHCNAFNGSASGTEMIHYPGSARGMALARGMQRAAVLTLKLPDRGIKPPQAGGRGNALLAGTRCPAIIAESFFIDNAGDLARANAVREALAMAYAEAIVEFARSL